jgi:hypothetical protein
MTKEQAQKKLYLLSEVFGELLGQIRHLDDRAKDINRQRRCLLNQFPTLDIRIPSRLPVEDLK